MDLLKEALTPKRFIIVITAPSGAGKTTVIRRLVAADNSLYYSISATTRPRREGETDGRDYFFLTDRDFRQRLDSGQFAEWAEVHGHLYGTLKSQIEETLAGGRHVVMDVDVQGAESLRRVYPDGVYVYLIPPSMGELRRRLVSRGTEDEESLARRLKNSMDEIRKIPSFDYLVVNDSLDLACREIGRIIRSEELRVSRLPEPSRLVKAYLEQETLERRRP
jgi:guanylate kinase